MVSRTILQLPDLRGRSERNAWEVSTNHGLQSHPPFSKTVKTVRCSHEVHFRTEFNDLLLVSPQSGKSEEELLKFRLHKRHLLAVFCCYRYGLPATRGRCENCTRDVNICRLHNHIVNAKVRESREECQQIAASTDSARAAKVRGSQQRCQPTFSFRTTHAI